LLGPCANSSHAISFPSPLPLLCLFTCPWQSHHFGKDEFFARRPWHSETYWPIGGPHGHQAQQTLHHLQWHEQQLQSMARSPRSRAAAVIRNIQSSLSPPLSQPPHLRQLPLPRAPPQLAPQHSGGRPSDMQEHRALEALAASVAERVTGEASKQMIGRHLPSTAMPIPKALLHCSALAHKLDQRAWTHTESPHITPASLSPVVGTEKLPPTDKPPSASQLTAVSLPPTPASKALRPPLPTFQSANHQKPATSPGFARSMRRPTHA